MEAARPSQSEDVGRIVVLARSAREEMLAYRGGALHVSREARAEPLEETLTPFLRGATDELLVSGLIDDVVVGYGLVAIETLRTQQRLGVVHELYVEPEARAIGVGEEIMNALVAFCERAGCVGVDARALPGDRGTKNFFETFGLVAREIVVHRKLGNEAVPT